MVIYVFVIRATWSSSFLIATWTPKQNKVSLIVLFLLTYLLLSATYSFLSEEPKARKDEERIQFCRVDESVHPIPQPINDMPCMDGAQDGEFAIIEAR